jgi:hypothetical protein
MGMYCKICNQETKYELKQFSQFHLRKEHNINIKDYYDKYFRKDGEGFCLECGKETVYNDFRRGYRIFCSFKCAKSSDYVANRISESFLIRDIEKEKQKRKDTCLEKYGVDHISKSEEIKHKIEKSNFERFGVKTNLITKECYDKRWEALNDRKDVINEKRKLYWSEENVLSALNKRKETCLEKYGVDSVFKINEIKEKLKSYHDNKKENTLNRNKGFKKYKKEVYYLTEEKRNELFSNWDGKDYYTRERLITNDEYINMKHHKNVNTNKRQPTIDHKISIHYGFLNKIPIEDVADLKNLCVCGRSINCLKHELCEYEFKNILKEIIENEK